MGGKDLFLLMFLVPVIVAWSSGMAAEGKPRRILLDTDVDTDDIFALLYLLKQNRSQFELEVCFLNPLRNSSSLFVLFFLRGKQKLSEHSWFQAVTINANAWTDAGHAVNHVYDILYMMNRDDIPVGVGGDGGILDDGTILPDVGGYHPLIEQVSNTDQQLAALWLHN